MKSYNYLASKDINRENLVVNEDFLDDAANYLYKSSKGELDLTDPDEIYEEFQQRMRYHDVNEVSTISDLLYAQEADEESKAEMGRLFDVYDKSEMSTEDFVDKAVDYTTGIATAPSTWLGILTGGSGKVASIAGQSATKLLVRKTLKGALRAGITEGVIGAGQNVAQQGTRMELDPERDFSGKEFALTTAASAVPGVTFGGFNALRLGKKSQQADILKAQGEEAAEALDSVALTEAEKVIKNADSKKVKEVKDALGSLDKIVDAKKATKKETKLVRKTLKGALKDAQKATKKDAKLDPLDPESTAIGDQLFSDIAENIDPEFRLSFTPQEFKRMQAAFLEFSDVIPRTPGKRISEDFANAFSKNGIADDLYSEIMLKYNLNGKHVKHMMLSSVSDAARLLRAQRTINEKNILNIERIAKTATEAGENLGIDVGIKLQKEAIKESTIQNLKENLNGFERIRRSIMTSQPVTTLRNVFGGASRIGLDMFEEAVETSTTYFYNRLTPRVAGATPIKERSVFKSSEMIKYILDTPEADLIADLYRNIDKEGYERFFSSFIDAGVGTTKIAGGSPTKLESIGNIFNVFNKMSDNFFKKAAFSGELSRLVKQDTGKDLIEIIKEGKFNQINPKLFNQAMDKAFEMVYQKTPKADTGIFGQAARGWLKMDKEAGFVSGLLIPFPRFVINQIQFMYEHAPIVGAIPLERFGAGKNYVGRSVAKRIAQQASGFSMVGAFMALRNTQDPGTLWYNVEGIIGEEGTKDLRPFLGPMNLELYLADTALKMIKGEPQPDVVGISQDLIQTAVGSSMRAGSGLQLINEALPSIAGAFKGTEAEGTLKFKQIMGEIAGNYLNTYTLMMPLSVAKDLYSLTDEQLRLIPETGKEVSTWDIMFAKAGRSLGPFRSGLSRLGFDYEEIEPRFSIMRETPARKVNPIATMTSGLNISENATAVEKEANRLQIRPYQVYRRFRFGPADVKIRQEVSQRLTPVLDDLIKRDAYQKMTDKQKIVEFKTIAREEVRKTSSRVINELLIPPVKDFMDSNPGATPEMIKLEFGYTLNDIYKFKYENEVSSEVRALINEQLGAPSSKSDYSEYLMRGEAYKTKQFNSGGLVGGLIKPEEQIEDETTRQMVGLGLDLAPVTGEIRSAQAAVEDFEKGDYGMATLGALGAVPGVGMVARGAKTGVKAISKYADELWDVPTQKVTSADTSINQSKLPAGYTKLKKMGVFQPGQRVVDIGGGRFDNAVEDLAKQDVELQVYDPFNRTPDHNNVVKELVADGGADVAVSNNTLNVIKEPKNIKRVIQQAENAIKPGDKAYFTVYAGDKSGKGKTTSKGYQRNEPTSAYVSRVEEVFGEGNVQSKGDLITATKSNDMNRGGLMSRT